MSFLPGIASGVIQGGFDLISANAQQKAAQQDAQQAAQAAQAQQQQAFNQQLGYINSSNAAQRAAIVGEGNPLLAGAAGLNKPTPTALPTQANMGGQVFGGGSATPSLAGASSSVGAAPAQATMAGNSATTQGTPQFGGGGAPQQLDPRAFQQMLAMKGGGAQPQPQSSTPPQQPAGMMSGAPSPAMPQRGGMQRYPQYGALANAGAA